MAMQCSSSKPQGRAYHQLYLSLGSNLGDREQLIQDSLHLLSHRVGQMQAVARLVETEPVGFVSAHKFLNTVALFYTTLSPIEVLELTQEIERELGRSRKSHGGVHYDRPIDIDLLLYDDLVMQTERLSLPHPRMHLRRFVLEPLAELAPNLLHPTLGRSVRDLLAQLG